MTTYCSEADLNLLLDGFVNKYYGTFLDDGEDVSISTQYYLDLHRSYDQTNEIVSGINHIKSIPFGTQSDGNYPFHVRMLQGNLMIYHRLRSRHYGEFTDGIPGWVNTFKNAADSVLAAIRDQNVVFDVDTTIGEAGIGVGSFSTRAGSANLYTNWETGVYRGYEFPRQFVVEIDGTSEGNVIGSATFKWSMDGGYSFEATAQTTSTAWIELIDGAFIRWAYPTSGSMHCSMGDKFTFRCVPLNTPTKAGNIRITTFLRG